MSRRSISLVAGALVLLLGTVLVFRTLDSHSHSASDTLRPFVLTMAPVWALCIAAARVVLRDRTRVCVESTQTGGTPAPGERRGP